MESMFKNTNHSTNSLILSHFPIIYSRLTLGVALWKGRPTMSIPEISCILVRVLSSLECVNMWNFALRHRIGQQNRFFSDLQIFPCVYS